jgi:hypothetical protein
MKNILLSAIVFCFFTLTASEIFACSCNLPIGKQSQSKQVKTAYKAATAVFYSEVVSISKKPENFYVTVKFKVEKSWKSLSEEEVIIKTGIGGGDCGYPFEIGTKYLVYAFSYQNSLGTNICRRTSPSDADAKYLDKIKKPKLFAKESERENQ